MNQRTECCSQCPFARSTSKEYLDTKGDNGERFIGQSIGPFILPCHMHRDFEQWVEKADSIPQCAGAAKYRANIGVSDLMPEALGRLPADTETVFANPEELLAHHRGVPIEYAKMVLTIIPPIAFLEHEMNKQEMTILKSKLGKLDQAT